MDDMWHQLSRSKAKKRETFICLECQQIDLEKVIGLGFATLQSKENSEGILVADLGSRCSSPPMNGCCLCQFLYATRCKPQNSHQHYQLRVYSYLKNTRTVLFSKVPKRLRENDLPCLGIVPVGLKSKTFRNETSDAGHVFCLKGGQNHSRMFQPHIRPHLVDFHLANKWLQFCKSTHENLCDQWTNKEQLEGLKLIDCCSNLIVAAPAGACYAALSYVWGCPKINKDNGASSSDSINTSSSPFSQTIRDAIIVTKKLGMKFLWVDKYCIDQTDAKEKHDQISQMGLIYRRAEITIIAAAGDDADSGLHGVGDMPRRLQPIAEVGDFSVISTMALPYQTIPASTWATRGWTLQEAVLSRRRLAFTENQVYFECYNMTCSENLPPDLQLVHGTSDIAYRFLHRGIFTGRINSRFKIHNESWIGGSERYLELTMDYSARTLTYESDFHNAFAGIMGYFLQEYGVLNIWGVPVIWSVFRWYKTFFAKALLWYHKACVQSSKAKPYRRQCSLNESSQFADGHTVEFPSWSWVGWCGEIAYPDTCHWHNLQGFYGDVRLEIPGRKEQTPLNDISRDSILAKFDSQPDALILEANVVDDYDINLDDGSFPRKITIKGCSVKWLLSEGSTDPKSLFEMLKSRKIELLEILTDFMANETKGRVLCLVVENHKDYSSRVGIATVEGVFSIPGSKKVVRLK